MLWAIIYYYVLLLKLFQLWPLAAPSGWSLCPLDMLPLPFTPTFFFKTTLSYHATNMLQVYLVFSLLQALEFIISLGSPVSF